MYGLTELYTGITPPRLANLIAFSHMCHELPGCFAEFGVMQGGSLDMLARCHPERKIYGIDSFEGLPAPTEFDVHKAGDFALTGEQYEKLVRHFTHSRPNVEIIKGFSPGAFQKLPPDIQFAFVHVDVDLYTSVNDALDYFWPRLVKGGVIIFDDYGFGTTPGAKKAINEFPAATKWRGELFYAGHIFTGQYAMIK